MSKVISLAARRRGRNRIYFTRADLSCLLQLYSRRVANGEWRDYAIDHRRGMAAFSVFRHSSDQPLYAVVKTAGNAGSGGEWLIYQGRHRLKHARTLTEALTVFDREVRLISSGRPAGPR